MSLSRGQIYMAPTAINWATAGDGSTPHFVAEMLKEAPVSRLNIVPIGAAASA